MKLPILAAVLAVALTFGAGFWSSARPTEAAVDNLNITQTCTTDGRLTARFVWDAGNAFVVQQWMDLSLQDNHWAPGTYLGNGPMPAAQGGLTWTGLQQGARHFVRINQWLPGQTVGAGPDWEASPTFYFDTGYCTPGATGVAGVILPSGGTGSTLPPVEADRKRELAPIDDARVVSGAQPGSFVVQAKAGLPGGCARQGGYEVDRQGPNQVTVITVTIYNTMPALQNMVCTAIYGTYDVTADLGPLTPGQGYEIHVNDKTVPFALP
jgi:hypothetical protein